jgi:hypothetical protein
VGEAHDTPVSKLDDALVGFKVGWIDQLVPFQPSAKVRLSVGYEPLVRLSPTAMQAAVEVHDTPLSALLNWP